VVVALLSKDDSRRPSVHDLAEGAKGSYSNVADAASYAAGGIKDFAKHAHMPSGEEVLDSIKDRIPSGQEILEDVQAAGRASGSVLTRMAGRASKKVKAAYEDADSKVLVDNLPIPKTIHDQFPWLPSWWSRNATIWDFFKLLVDKYRYFWWTQQWMTGYLAWAVFVGIESKSA